MTMSARVAVPIVSLNQLINVTIYIIISDPVRTLDGISVIHKRESPGRVYKLPFQFNAQSNKTQVSYSIYLNSLNL